MDPRLKSWVDTVTRYGTHQSHQILKNWRINPRLQSWIGASSIILSNGFNRFEIRFWNENR